MSRFPLGGIRDLTDILKKLRIHQVLEAGDFLDIERSLYAAKNLNAFFRAKKSGYHLVRMAEYGDALVTNDDLRTRINRTIREDGYVLDSASAELGRIRKELASMTQAIRRRMDQLAKSSSLVDALQDQIVTMRATASSFRSRWSTRAACPASSTISPPAARRSMWSLPSSCR